MLPPAFPDGSPSNAERKVFEQLAGSSIPGVALHSLNLPEHEHKLTAELDFVLLTDDVVLALEVKGGRVAQTGGTWTFTDRYDVVHRSPEGPFRQVVSGMHALRARVTERFPGSDKLPFGFLVITPDVDLPMSAEWVDETYVGRGPFSRGQGLERAVARARTYWLDRQPDAQPLGARRKEVLDFLRPDFDRVPSLASVATNLDREYLRLTEEQASRLDILMDSQRLVCGGGAGTGKTFMAIEAARRHAQAGRATLLVCRSRVLTEVFRGRLSKYGVDVLGLEDLPTGKRYEQLVVDEGQDLATYDALQRLGESLNGGIEAGRWAVFLDPNRQAHLYGDHDPEALEYLYEAADARPMLRHNCRNTRGIAFHTRAVTGADLGVAAAGAGPKVQMTVVQDGEDEKRSLEGWLRELRDADVPPGQITVVSQSGTWETSVARHTKAARKSQMRRIDAGSAAGWPFREISWATALDVKGLENQFVAVVDVDELISEESLDRMYVAMSRPRAGLWVAIPAGTERRMKELLALNSADATAAYGGTT